MGKTRTPINGTGKSSSGNKTEEWTRNLYVDKWAKNSPAKNPSSNSNQKKLVRQNAFVTVLASLVHSATSWIHDNFALIMSAFFLVSWVYLFTHGTSEQMAALIVLIFSIVSIFLKETYDGLKNDSTLDKFANFKRFTHKRANGSIDIKQAEIEQIILYLYELEEYMGKPDKDE